MPAHTFKHAHYYTTTLESEYLTRILEKEKEGYHVTLRYTTCERESVGEIVFETFVRRSTLWYFYHISYSYLNAKKNN